MPTALAFALFFLAIGSLSCKNTSKVNGTETSKTETTQHMADDNLVTPEDTLYCYNIANRIIASESTLLSSEDKALIWALPIPNSTHERILALVGPSTGMNFDFNFDFVTLDKIDNKWQITNVDSQAIGSGESGGANYLHASDFLMNNDEMPKYVELKQTPYVFFMCREGNAGNAMPLCSGMLYFGLYNLLTKKITTINFECWTVQIELNGKYTELVDGEFVKTDKTPKEYVVETDYLLKQAEKSPYIFHPSADDLNMDLSRNAIERWLQDNAKIVQMEENESGTIQFTYYDIDKYYKRAEDNALSSISNEDFEVLNVFKGSVYALNKKKQKYFIVYAFDYDCYEKNISWVNDSCLKLESYLGLNLVIDLKSGKVLSYKNDYQ